MGDNIFGTIIVLLILAALVGLVICKMLRQHRTTTGYRLCRTSACRFSVILHRNSLTYVSKPASFLYNLTKNLTTHLYDNGCAALPKKEHFRKIRKHSKNFCCLNNTLQQVCPEPHCHKCILRPQEAYLYSHVNHCTGKLFLRKRFLSIPSHACLFQQLPLCSSNCR